MKKIGQFSSVSSGRSSYYAGTTLLRFFDMKMKIQLLVASYHLLQWNNTKGKLLLVGRERYDMLEKILRFSSCSGCVVMEVLFSCCTKWPIILGVKNDGKRRPRTCREDCDIPGFALISKEALPLSSLGRNLLSDTVSDTGSLWKQWSWWWKLLSTALFFLTCRFWTLYLSLW